MLYFDHSTTAATDPKIMQLRLECGGAAVDAYWYLVEQMHRDERAVCASDAGAMRVHCHTLCTDLDTLRSWVSSMVSIGLLERVADGGGECGDVVSPRAAANIEAYRVKSEKARSSAKARWANAQQDAGARANAKRTHKRAQSDKKENAMLTKQNKTNSSSANKGTTTNASGGAAAAVAAPAEAPRKMPPACPMCGGGMTFDPRAALWRCRDGGCRATLKPYELGGEGR